MSDVGRIIGAVFGEVIGFAIGGPAGAWRGAALGWTLGASREQASPNYSFSEMQNTVSREIPIPVVYGRNKIAGNIIYQKVSDDGESMDVQVAVSEGPIQSITSIKADDKDITATVRLGQRVQAAVNINPDETFPFTAYYSASINASEDLSGNPTFTAIVEGRIIDVWNGSQWVQQYSNNPAYCLLDFITNTRYGLGIDKTEIDLDSFIEVANYCDELVDGEKRFEFDMIIDVSRSSLDIIQEIMATFRAFFVYANGKLRLKVDAPEEPVQTFTMDNIVENSFSYSYNSLRETPNEVIVKYTDADNDFEITPAQYLDESDIEQRGERIPKTIELMGINRFSQAGRRARYIQKLEKFCPMWAKWKAGIDSVICEPGDVVIFSHDVPGWTGKKFRIMEMRESQNEEIEITAREYNEAIYSDDGVIYQPSEASTLPSPFEPPANVSNLTIIETGEHLGDGTFIPGIKIDYIIPLNYFWKYARIYYKKTADVDWIYHGRTEENNYIIKPVEPGEYDVRVVSENKNGVKANFGTSPSGVITITGNVNPPADTDFIDVNCSFENAVILQWTKINDKDIKAYEVRTNLNWGNQDRLVYYGDSTSWIIEEPYLASYTFYVKAINTSDVYSANYGSIALLNAVPPQPSITLSSSLSQITIAVEDPEIADFNKVEYQIDDDSGFASPEIKILKDLTLTYPVVVNGLNYVRVRFIDRLGQQGPWASGSINAQLITQSEMQGAIFQIIPSSTPEPTSGTLAELWDANTGTGPVFGSAPTITFEFPMMWFFDMVRFYPSTAVNYYVQAWINDSWVDVTGSSVATANQWNIKKFNNMIATNKLRIIFDAALTLYELKFWTITLADEILAQTLTLTGNMKIQSEDSSVLINSNSLKIGDRLKATLEGIWGYAQDGVTKRAGFNTDGQFIAGSGALIGDENGLRGSDGTKTTFYINEQGQAFFEGELGTVVKIGGREARSTWRIEKKQFGSDAFSFLSNTSLSIAGVEYYNGDILYSDWGGGQIVHSDINGNVIRTISLPTNAPSQIAFDGTYIWYYDTQTKYIYQIDINGNMISNFTVSGQILTGICWHNDQFYVIIYNEGGNEQVAEVNTSGTILKTIPLTFNANRIAYDGKYFWIGVTSDFPINKVDMNGNVIKSFNSVGGLRGLSWGGGYLWYCEVNNDKVHAVNVYDIGQFIGIFMD